jgi:hypothetical protein
MSPRDIALDVLIAVAQQHRVLTAAGRLSQAERQAVRDILIRAHKQAGIDFWEGACERADGEP